MRSQLRLSSDVLALTRCPKCQARLTRVGEFFECTNAICAAVFPVVDGIPALTRDQSMRLHGDDNVMRRTFFGNKAKSNLKRTILSLIPSIGKNIRGGKNIRRISQMLFSQSPSPRVLVLGGGILGQGMEQLTNNTAIDLVESDMIAGPRTMLICDAHDIPFADRSFDAVIVQAVLEHVVDPYRCAEEIHRVLKDQGIVYAETAFMQQVHGGRFDFTRFTHLGHRRLFRRFQEIDSGAVGGPGMALAWSYQYFLLSFATSRISRALIRAFTSATSFYFKYFDSFLIDKPGTLDAASGYYFIGLKANEVLSDKDLMELYRGAG
jgi:SAM-dependent methyltransferase